MGEEDNGVEIGGMILGAIVLGIAMLLPLITVQFTPPHGSAVVGGQKISAFHDTITGWQFAQEARWSHIVLFFIFVILRLTILLIPEAVGAVRSFLHGSTSYTHALVHITFIVGWILVLGLAVAFGDPSMPPGGESGILGSFHGDPISPGYQSSHTGNVSTPYLSASLGAGWWVMLAGIFISAASMWRKVALSLVVLIAALILLAIVDAVTGKSFDTSLIRWLDGLH